MKCALLALLLGAPASALDLSAPLARVVEGPAASPAMPGAAVPALPAQEIPVAAAPELETAQARPTIAAQAQLEIVGAARPKETTARAGLVFDGAPARADAPEPVLAAQGRRGPGLAASLLGPSLRRRPVPSSQAGFARGDLATWLGVAGVVALVVGTIAFAFKLSPVAGLITVAAFAYLIRSIARFRREERRPRSMEMPRPQALPDLEPLPPLETLRDQLNAALDHLIRTQQVKNRDVGEISRGLSELANDIQARRGFSGRRGWTDVDPRLMEAIQLPGILERVLSQGLPRDGVGPHTFFAQLDQLFDGLRAEARRASSPEDLLQKLRWWPAHYRQSIP